MTIVNVLNDHSPYIVTYEPARTAGRHHNYNTKDAIGIGISDYI
jgi:hypothetical protein